MPELRRIIRKRDLPRYVGIRRTAIDEQIKSGTFPKPVKLGVRAIGWREVDLIEWQQRLKTTRA